MQQMIFIADFIACSTCFGRYYVHHQELESIIQMVAACGTIQDIHTQPPQHPTYPTAAYTTLDT